MLVFWFLKANTIDRHLDTQIFLCEVKKARTAQAKPEFFFNLYFFYLNLSFKFILRAKKNLSSYICPDICKGICNVCYIFMSIDMDLFCVTCFKNVCWKHPLKKKTDSEILGNFSQILWLISTLRWTFFWYEFYSEW